MIILIKASDNLNKPSIIQFNLVRLGSLILLLIKVKLGNNSWRGHNRIDSLIMKNRLNNKIRINKVMLITKNPK